MSVIDGAVRKVGQAVGRTAAATTMAAGAVGGAAVNGVIGGVTGTVAGVRSGVSTGSRSTPAAALTFGLLGVSELVAWPLVAAVGGGALLLRKLDRSAGAVATPVPDTATKSPAATATAVKSTTAKSAPTKATKATPKRTTQDQGATVRRLDSAGKSTPGKRSSRR